MAAGVLKNVIIAAGGTGGHLFPGVAVAEFFAGRFPDAGVTFVGVGREVERKVLSEYDFDYVRVKSPRLNRSLHPKNLLIPFRLLIALLGSLRLLAKIKPQVVIGTGSYGSIPVVIAARLKKIPTMILEQNIIPSVTNRLLSRFSDCVCLAYPPARDWLGGKAEKYVTGNPIRKPQGAMDKAEARRKLGLRGDLFTVAVFGGSQGAVSIASAAKAVLPLLSDKPIQMIVQTTPVVEIETDDKWKGRLLVRDFYENIYDCYAATDLVVGRAGSGLSEALAFGIPMILIPYPYSAHGHQEKNAVFVEQEGAARVISDDELSGKMLAEKITRLMENVKELDEMARAARELGRMDAAERVVRIAEGLVN
ncbi:MAG: undecaprenyldiphospho-muramoylpentapeptide beta-N-acetylglucosaminyltransferase [bacterium]|nr:undecaprenyldiphospho-muramoylpentapeptide beta-N-acetylglucosaminyltransferase [bacterium]